MSDGKAMPLGQFFLDCGVAWFNSAIGATILAVVPLVTTPIPTLLDNMGTAANRAGMDDPILSTMVCSVIAWSG